MRRRTMLHLMLIRGFVPVLLIALAFFVTILQLVDLFDDVTSYVDREIPFFEVFRVQVLYLPKSLHFALPMALLFAVSFTLGTLYSRNELIAVFGSGVSLQGFVAPLVAAGLLFSVGSFFFEEAVVIETLSRKLSLERELLNVSSSRSNSNVTRIGSGSRIVYQADFYNDETTTLSGVLLLERDEAGNVLTIVSARTARWNGESWDVQSARIFERGASGTVERFSSSETLAQFDLPPGAFRRIGRDIDQMQLAEAQTWIESLRSAGLPYREDLTKYHERFSFALTPFIVVLIATAIGGRFRKNILLMSLLVSLSVSVVYYVTQMISGLLAYSGRISPIFGAWSGVLVFVVIGIGLLRLSRT
ncbi:MAG TPA: LptF/LptG family permease [Spirochaetia bacterium]|nr:LptF/LptG family permease [Spirochaetia bacterium]